jgi:hypothetical protein
VPGSLVFKRTRGPVDLRDFHNWWAYVPGACWYCLRYRPAARQGESVDTSTSQHRLQVRCAGRLVGADPAKHWKLSPMDLEARSHWVDYSRAEFELLG